MTTEALDAALLTLTSGRCGSRCAGYCGGGRRRLSAGGRGVLHRTRGRCTASRTLRPSRYRLAGGAQTTFSLHLFGTDELGRDVLARVIWGARASLMAGLVSVSIALTVAVPLGLVSGYLGGVVDGLLMRIIDAMLAIPFLVLAIALAAFLGPSLTNAMIAIGVVQTPIFTRLTRGQALAVKHEDYIEAARAVGNPHCRILLRHILPNILAPILVQATLAIAAAIIAEASLSFLGLGQQPPAPSWGSMLNTASHFLSQAPWMAVWPGLAIFSLVLSFNLLGDGLRDALDPRGG